MDVMHQSLDPNYAGDFMSEYFPESKTKKIVDLKLDEIFVNDTSPEITDIDETSETFLIPGKAWFESDLYKPGQRVSEGHVTLEVRVRHNPEDGASGKVVWVKVSNDLAVPDNVPIPQKGQN